MLKQLQDKPRQLSAPKASRLMWLDSSSQVVSLLHEDTLIHGVKGGDNLHFSLHAAGLMHLPINPSGRLLYGYLWEQMPLAPQRALLCPHSVTHMAGQAQEV